MKTIRKASQRLWNNDMGVVGCFQISFYYISVQFLRPESRITMEMHSQSEMVVEVDEKNQSDTNKDDTHSSIHAKEVITIKRISQLFEV